MKPGVYTFYNEQTDCYLSYEGNTLTLSDIPQNWNVKSSYEQGFYIYAGDTELLLDIDNAFVSEGTTIKIWQMTGYEVQVWNIEGNANSTYSFLCSVDHNYCLGFDNGKAVLQIRDADNGIQEWKATPIDVPKEYCSFMSEGKIIELQLPLDISTVISDSRLQKWATHSTN